MSRFATRLSRWVVATALTASVALTLAQQAGTVGPWWLELSRYLPYPALLAPAGVSLVLSCWLGWRWVLGSVATLVVVATVGMGWVWGRPDTATDGRVAVRLMTYNIKSYKAALRTEGFADLAREVASHHPDILVAQDNHAANRAQASAAWPGGRAFGLPYAFVVDQYIVASRYPLRDCAQGAIDYRGQAHAYVRCVVEVDGLALSVATAHFESPRNGLNAARREGLEGADDWQQNYEDRLGQSRALAKSLEPWSRPMVVAGDLNAPEASSVVRTLLGIGLRDAYSSAARGYGYSYGQALRLGFSFLRIDHILVSPEVGVADCFVGNGDASDHRPVIADLLLQRP